jgi:hypothetical protein
VFWNGIRYLLSHSFYTSVCDEGFGLTRLFSWNELGAPRGLGPILGVASLGCRPLFWLFFVIWLCCAIALPLYVLVRALYRPRLRTPATRIMRS